MKKKKKKHPIKQKSVQHGRRTQGKVNGNLNKETVGKICRKFWNHLEAVIEANEVWILQPQLTGR